MSTFPRTVLPEVVSIFQYPPPLYSVGKSGKAQFRQTAQRGRIWSEEWPPLKVSDASVAAFLALCGRYYASGEIFTISYLDKLTPKGAGGGSPIVNGTNQTGTNLVAQVTASGVTGWLVAGDIFSIAGVNPIFDAQSTIDVGAAGTVAIPLYPPILAGQSPVSGAAITITGVTLRAAIIDMSPLPTSGPNDFLMGFKLTFRECV